MTNLGETSTQDIKFSKDRTTFPQRASKFLEGIQTLDITSRDKSKLARCPGRKASGSSGSPR